ncbi:non-ribosomal peptide synthase/polyketide synthase [Nocardia asteroides]|uniref:non-ribosomal peptide synthase/polyketide synthase n=1 Tax=Nocardia asteroides TaxID=1824 RepID=UPI001E50EB96|nr:non-ribosomal peptide synthase/polyketide synthase [Nocardia asteroides]UGT57903.1 non-ribosomal peptide synthase/polyketide synthase [Nocardia asteroides]
MHGTELGGFSARPQDAEVAGATSVPFPLTPAQLGVWYAQLLDPEVPITIAQYVDISGELDAAVLQQVTAEAAHAYGSPLVRIGETDGVPCQIVDHSIPVETELPLIDLRHHDDPIAAAHEWMRAEFGAPLDLLTDRLVAGAVLRVGERRWFWYLRGHHIVLDGYGAFANSQRIAELYTARVLGTEPRELTPGDLAELVEGEQRYRESTRFDNDRAHWAERIAGLDSPTSLDSRTAPRAAINLVTGGRLSEQLVDRLETIAASDDSTIAAVLLAAFAAYLGRLTDRPDAVLSLPVTARTTAVMRRSAGMLSNIVPLRLPTGSAGAPTTWGELLRAARVEVAGALRHQRYRAEDIRRDAEDDGRPARRALFGPLANFMLFKRDLTLGTTTGRYRVLSTGPIEDLSLNVYYGDRDRVHVDFEANPNLYDADTLARHHARFLGFLERLAAADLSTPIGSIEVATELELQVSTKIWNATSFDVAAALAEREVAAATLPALFEAQLARTPDAVAVRMAGDDTATLTYRELARRAHRLARRLRADGIGPETLVALSIRRSPELVVAMYAVLAAGAAYVPLDPDHPAERIAHILDTAAPAVVLTTTADGAPGAGALPVLAIDALELGDVADTPLTDAERTAPLRPGQPAYVIFTSGSTGLPKGVAVEHAAIVNRLVWMQQTYRLHGVDVVLQKTPMTFDVSVWEFFWPLQIGATLLLAEPDGHRDPGYLRRVIAEYGVTVAHFVPSMLEAFLAQQEIAERTSLRLVFASGEALPAASAQRLRLLTGARLHNLYGPTEAAVDVTFHEVNDADRTTVPIGAPVFNTRLHVLDSRLRPVPVGAPGELYLSGVQLARGYVARPELTAGRFVADPNARGERMYRTGDLVRWTTNGELEYLGRTDFQVKLRGLRIELGEIEAVLEGVEGAARAVVVVRDDAGVGEQLVAYVVESEPGAVAVARLREAALRALPAYMVPAAFVLLDALPVNASGKLDRKALPAPARTVVAYAAPEGPVEQAVARVFGEVLGLDRVGRDDDFFALGGNSLVATQVAARLGADLGCRLGVRDLFGATTPARLAAAIADGAGAPAALPMLTAGSRPALLPLSPAQQRIWFLNRFDPAAPGYNMPFVVRLPGTADVRALVAALAAVVDRHEALRTVFPAVDATGGEVAQQVVRPTGAVRVDDPTPITAAELDAALAEFAGAGFDLEHEVPFRARLFAVATSVSRAESAAGTGVREYALAVVLHHIAADGVSLRVLIRDVLTAYQAATAGVEPAWAPLRVQYADYALWQRELLGADNDPRSLAAREIAFWERTLAGLPDQLDLPSARPRPVVSSMRGAQAGFTVDAALHRRLTDLAHRAGTSLFMVLHTALAVLLARLSGTTDIAIGTGVAGRGDRAVDELIGMFVNTLVLRTEIDPAASFAATLEHAREVDLAAFAHATVPFDRLVEVVNPARSQARHPLFQVALNFQAALDTTFDLGGAQVSVHELDLDIAKFDLQLTLDEKRGAAGEPAGIDAVTRYATDLFDEDGMVEFGARFVRLLAAAVAAPEAPVGDLPLLSAAEHDRLIGMRGGPVTATGLLPDLLAGAVAADPERVAVTDGERALTYRELDRASSRLARVLIDGGVGPDDIVAVGIPRSVESVLAVWAIAKTGAAWLPVDPSYPLDRITHMVTDSGARVGLTVSAAQAALPGPAEWLVLDELKLMAECAARSSDPVGDTERVRPLRAEHLAYVIYTSGSTGLPKGVLVTQAGIAGFAAEESARMFGTADARVLQVGSPSFDISVMETLLAVNSAATLVIAPNGRHIGAELARLLVEERVTHALMTPSGLAVLDPEQLTDLRMVMVGGEACPPDLVARWTEGSVPRAFVNAYGPSETTVATNISAPLAADGPLTLGAPLRGIAEWVLDARLRPVPAGVAGELYVAGAQVARGYHGRAELTAARFVACPWEPGARMYRTGDLVRWTADGTLEYLGRNDDQVKLRGFRIELGEIESALLAQPTVRRAVVVVRSDTHRGDQLVAYVVPDDTARRSVAATEQKPGEAVGFDVDALADSLRDTLAPHMVPSAFVVLDALPLTPNGKLDRRALPEPVFAAREFRAPAEGAETVVARVFGEVLGVERVGADDDFFALGGNSLVATQVVGRLGAALGVTVSLKTLFDASTVAGLAELLGTPDGTGSRAPLVAVTRPQRIPLSYAQQRMWFLNQFDGDSVADNIAAAIRLTGALDQPALTAAVSDVFARHEALRTRYPAVDGIPFQQVLGAEQLTITLQPEPVDPAALDDRIRAVAAVPFAVDQEPPVRLRLLRTGVEEHVLVLVVHHIAADGWSVAPLTRDLMVAYAARHADTSPSWAPLPVQYADFALWQRAVLGAEDEPESPMARQIDFWTAELADLPDLLALPTDRPRPAVASGRGARHAFTVPAAISDRLRALAADHNASLFMVLHAAFAATLAKLSGQQDISVGTPVAGRGDPALDELVGMFVNTLVLRAVIDPAATFAELVGEVRERDLRALAHPEVTFDRLVEAVDPVRSTARHPLFQVMLDFQNNAATELELAGLTAAEIEIDTHTAKFDLQLTVRETVDGLLARIEYATDLFDAATITDFGTRLVRVLDAVSADPNVVIGDIDLLSAAERTRVLRTWNETAYPVGATMTLASLFAAQAARTPDAVALSFEGESFTYAEFAGRVNRLARLLISIGVRADRTVALGMRRSVDLVVAMYAVQAAGGAYVPLDPEHPAERLTEVIAAAAPVCVLTRAADDLDLPTTVPVLELEQLDTTDCPAEPVTDADRLATLTPAHAAYLIFTSGSTGKPKGVVVSHGAIVNRLVWMQDAYRLTPADTVLQKTPATFDVSVWEFFWPLQIGARLVIARPDGHRDPAYLADLIDAESVTVAHFVPSMLSVFVAELDRGRCASLRMVFASGEALPPAPAQTLRELTGTAVHNLYGPTEAAVDVTFHEVGDADVLTVPIGAPVHNTRVYVLDGRLRPVPVGVPGELYLAGAQLARGYVGRPDLTADRFVADPFALTAGPTVDDAGSAQRGRPAGARMYRTGDLVAWTAHGELEYLGRTDFQVKLRGLRIELGEIESALTALPSVAQAVVVVRSDEHLGDQLVGYLIPVAGNRDHTTPAGDPDAAIDLDAVRAELAGTLPGYMVPTAFVILDAFPLNASGKLDRKSLPAPAFEAAVFRAPGTEVERAVAATFAAVLGFPADREVGLDDDFFALGGNSLTATQVAARLGAALDTHVPVRLLFDAPTVADLAARCAAEQGRGRVALTTRERPRRIPLSAAQRRMWFLNRFLADADGPGDAVDNIPIALRLSGDLDLAALEAALADVIGRHETLRTSYPDGPDGAEQLIADTAAITLRPEPVTAADLPSVLLARAAVRFDLTAEIPLRVALFAVADEYVLVLVVHHIAADGFSLGPLAADLMTAYAARRDGAAPAWTPLPVQYADYTLWQDEILGAAADPASLAHAQLAFWRRELAGLPEQLELPTDRPRPEESSFRGDVHRFQIDSDLHSELRELARKHEATLFSTVHAALAVLLSRLSGSGDIAIGTPVAGRGEAAIDGLIGMFVNTLVLRTQIDPRAEFETTLDAVRAGDLDALSHADIPFEQVVEAVDPARARNRHPLFQVALVLQNFTVPALTAAGLTATPVDFDAPVAKFDLQFTVREADDVDGRADGMSIEIAYATDLFDASSVAVLARRFTQVLAAVVADPTVVVGDIQLLSAEEQQRTLHDWATIGDSAAVGAETMLERFARVAAAAPAAVAVIVDDSVLTYGELDAWSNRLARRLVGAGVGPESLVAVALPRTAELVVALLAVLKAGGGYLPIDPNYPADRIEYLLDDARPLCAIANADTGLPRDWFGGPVLDPAADNLDAFADTPLTAADRRAPLRPANTAYVIYTSGSTGRPKGVAVPHTNVLALLDNSARHFGFGPSDVWTLFHSYAFDFSVWELWGALLHGGSVVLVDYFTSRSPEQFRALLRARGVTVLNQTPSAFYQLVAADLAAEPADYALRTVIFGGEALEPQRLAGWFARYPDSPRLVNMYGITETTVHASYREITPATGSASVIGGPLAGLTVRVLDSRLRPVPVGVPGEIYVSGAQLARGYLGRPELTASRFVADPYGPPGARTYRSGDLARWTADGELEYLGRADQQVNLRGFRIELGEIEAALLASSAAPREAAVLVRADVVDEPRIVAYLVAGPDTGRVDTAALRKELARTLPEHMLPAAVVPVERIPLTVNGKLDRAALPAPVFETTTYRKPATVTEEIIAAVFAEVLGVGEQPVGADDDFFALGGSSLLAAKAVARIGTALDRQVGVRALFEAPRVAELAAAVETAAKADRPPLVGRARPARLPLSPAQQRMWFLNRFDRESVAYNIPFALRLSGELDVTALRSAVADLVARHESLRTVYPMVDAAEVAQLGADGIEQTAGIGSAEEGAPVQVILPVAQAVPSLEPVTVTAAELPDAIRELAATTFDVTVEIPVRLRLFHVTDRAEAAAGSDEFVLAAVLHHIAADGSSVGPFVADLMRAYTARLADTAPCWAPPAVQFADYALWQRELLGDETDPDSLAARQVDYWRTQLAGLPDQLSLPTDRPRPARQSLRGDKVSFTVDAELHAALVALGRGAGATLFMVVHAAFAALLARLSGTADIAVGTPVAGRGEAELDEVIGMFVNTLVLRTPVAADAPFTELLGAARAADIAAISHADVPFERLVEVLNPARSTARHPLFQVGYSFQNHERAQLELPGLTVSDIEFDSGVAQFDLHLFAIDHYGSDGTPAGIDLALGYATDLFDAATAERFVGQLRRILESVTAAPETVVGELDLLGGDRTLVLETWNATAHPVEPSTLSDLGARQARLTPGALALVDAETGAALDYAAFDARVNRIARLLIAEGVGPERTVVLAMRRGLDLVIAMHAVVRAGGAYVPIDPDHPVDRIAYIVATAAPRCVLTTAADGLPITVDVPLFQLDHTALEGLSDEQVTDAERLAPLRPEHPAYVIFTSGSTGRPKGVTVPHAAIVNQLAWLADRFTMTGADRVLLKTPATFDLSVWEFWSPLTSGGALIVTRPGDERDPDRLRATMTRHDVTVLHAVPSLIGMLLAAEAAPALPDSLRAVLAIGEALPAATANDFLASGTRARLHNLYGPTEAAVSITEHEVAQAPTHAVPIGGPAWNSAVYVLDARLRPVPIGVAGELYLAGEQLARGYHGRHALTADRFVANPFAATARSGSVAPSAGRGADVLRGSRMYRTGDIVRWRADGTLEYLERADFQVKIGGFRIELGEVETALLRCADVRAAVAIAKADERVGARLIAYVAVADLAPGTEAAIADRLRGELARTLPAYMVPAAVVVLDALPLNVNGKVDRARLPEPEFAEAAFRAPVTAAEQLVARTFTEVIGCGNVGLDDDFFALGGNSLMATRLAARLGAAVRAQVPVAAVFEAPTVAALAERLGSADRAEARPPLSRRRGDGPAVLSPAQQRMWVLHQLAPRSAAYHIPAALRLTGDLDLPAMQAAVADLLARHDTLRTRYPDTPSGPVQQVMPAWSAAVELSPIPVAADDLEARIAALVAQPFDITAAPPVRVALYRVAQGHTAPGEDAADEHVLVVVIHHISADGYSIAPLTRDLVRAYTDRAAGCEPGWAPLDIQYSDFSVWQHELLGTEDDPDSVLNRQLAYWTRELAGAPELLALPTDRPRATRREMHGAAVEFEVDGVLTRRLNEVARANGTTLFTVVHSALAVLLAKQSGSADITIGAPVAGRGVRELDDLVGMFVNTVALRTEVDSRAPFTDLLAQAKRRDLAALAHADVPFEQVVDAMGLARSGAYTPLFQVMLTFQNMPPGTVDLPGLRVGILDPGLTEAKFDLHLTALQRYTDDGGLDGLDLHFGYATDLFDESTVRTLAERFRKVLAAVAADPAVVVRAIDVRTDAEQTPRPRDYTIADLPGLVGSAARLAPATVAFAHGEHAISFATLDAKLTAVRKAMGAAMKPEALVNVALAGLVPGVLAALGASGLTTTLHTLVTDAAAVIAGSGSADDSEGQL